MYDDQNGGAEPRKNRREPVSRLRTPRATRSTRDRKPSGSGFHGVHRRRNKHWNW